MTTTLRAIAFGVTVAAGLAVALNAVAVEPVEVVHLEGVNVVAHKANFDADGNLRVVHLDPVLVVSHKSLD